MRYLIVYDFSCALYIIIYLSFKFEQQEQFNRNRILPEKNYKPAFLFTKVSKGHQKRNVYVYNSRLVKKICEKNRIIAKSTFFDYKMKDIDYMEKIRYKKCRYSKYLQNETWNIKIDRFSRKKINRKRPFFHSLSVH